MDSHSSGAFFAYLERAEYNLSMLNINTKSTNITLTPAIQEYIDKKLFGLEKFISGFDNILVNVEVGKTTRHHKQGDVFKAEIHIKVPGDEFYATVEKDDLYAAIDEVKDELIRNMTSRRKRALKLLRKGGQKIKEFLKGFRK